MKSHAFVSIHAIDDGKVLLTLDSWEAWNYLDEGNWSRLGSFLGDTGWSDWAASASSFSSSDNSRFRTFLHSLELKWKREERVKAENKTSQRSSYKSISWKALVGMLGHCKWGGSTLCSRLTMWISWWQIYCGQMTNLTPTFTLGSTNVG